MVDRILTGTYERILDEKLRIAIPKPLRKQFSQEELHSLFVAPGTEQSLSLYSPAAFHGLADRLSQQATNRIETRNYFRLLYSQADEVPFDAQGRIRITERLAAHAGLKHEIVLLGVQDHAEIWDKTKWEAFLAARAHEFDDMASGAFG